MEMKPELRPGSIASKEKEKEVKLIRILEKKIRGEPLPPNVDIPEVNLYGDTEPSELFDRAKMSPGKPIFFFTKLTHKSTKRKLRSCGSGKWDGRTAGKDVKLEDKVVLGVRKTFNFVATRMNGDGDSNDKKQQQLDQEDGGQLIMVEYSLGDGKVVVSDHVICKIEYKICTSSPKKKNTTKSATNNHHQVQGSNNNLMQKSASKPSSPVANKTSKRTNSPANQENRSHESDLNHKRVRSSMNTNQEGQSTTKEGRKMLDAGEFLYHGPGIPCTHECFLP